MENSQKDKTHSEKPFIITGQMSRDFIWIINTSVNGNTEINKTWIFSILIKVTTQLQ